MGRKRQGSKGAARTSTARKRKASRRQRTAAGGPRSTDWECPKCSQWFAKRQNGPENHLRFCLKQPSSPTKGTGAKFAFPPDILRNQSMTVSDDSEGSSSDSDSRKASDTDSDAPSNHFTRERGARRVMCRDSVNYNGKV
jgi:hypothetical protein